MGAATGFRYYYEDVLALNSNNVKAAYSFHIQSGNQIPTDSWTTHGFNGTVNNPTNFYSSSGSGAFNGTTYININSGLNLPNWTVFLTYQRARSGVDEILFSTLTGSNFTNSSGFVCGLNQANKLYFEYWNAVDGPQVFTFSEIIADKNMISITKSDSTIFFNYYDVNSKQSTVQQNPIYQNNFISNSSWYIGGRPANSFLVPINNFSGYIDNFVLVSGELDQSYQEILFSGFFSDYRTGSPTITTVCSNVVYQSGINTGLSTGNIGYQTIQVGSFVDNCGITNTTYSWSGVTGIISGSYFVPISGFGSQCINYTGQIPLNRFIDTGYLYGFGMNQISLLWPIESGDFLESNVITGEFQNTSRNKIAQYNALENRFFLDSNYESGDISLWLNTQLQLESGYNQVPVGYDFAYFLTGDYILTGNKVLSTGYYEEVDILLYDITNKTYNSIFFSGINSGQSYPYSTFANSMVFVNGVKQASGLDYILPNISLRQIGSGQNVLTVAPIYVDSVNKSGVMTGFLEYNQPFLKNSSQVFFNGMRQIPDDQYVENAVLDLLSGIYLEPLLKNVLYLNDDTFLNY